MAAFQVDDNLARRLANRILLCYEGAEPVLAGSAVP
jgi:hypothetical protein